MTRRLLPLALTLYFVTSLCAQAPPAVPVPQTPRELEALLSKLDQLGRGDDSDAGSSGIGPLLQSAMQLKDPKLVPVLSKQLLASSSWKVKAACVGALGNINTPSSTAALRKFLKSAPLPESPGGGPASAARGIRTQLDSWLYGSSVTAATQTLISRGQFSSIKDVAKRFSLYKEMASAGKPGLEALVELVREARKADQPVEDEGQLALSVVQLRSPDCLKPLRKCTLDKTLPAWFRQAALQALADGWKAQEYPTVIAVARSAHDYTLAANACTFAAAVDPQRARTDLLPFLDDVRPQLRARAAFLLGSFGDPSLIPELERLLLDNDRLPPNDDIRLAALQGLWLLDHLERKTTWDDPRYQKQYQDWMSAHPRPETPVQQKEPK